jgi:hypothetical protein
MPVETVPWIEEGSIQENCRVGKLKCDVFDRFEGPV